MHFATRPCSRKVPPADGCTPSRGTARAGKIPTMPRPSQGRRPRQRNPSPTWRTRREARPGRCRSESASVGRCCQWLARSGAFRWSPVSPGGTNRTRSSGRAASSTRLFPCLCGRGATRLLPARSLPSRSHPSCPTMSTQA